MAKEKFTFKKETGKKTNIIAILLVMIIVILAGGFVYYLSSQMAPAPTIQINTSNIQNTTTNNTVNQSITCGDECIYKNAIRDKKVTDCGQITNGSLEQMCFIAISNDSLDACELISNLSAKNTCIRKFALANNDTTICNQLNQNLIQACRLSVDACLNSTDINYCEAMRTGNVQSCDANSDCIMRYAIAQNNTDICKQITDTSVSSACRSIAGGANKCYLLPEIASQDLCYQITGSYMGDYNMCSHIQTGSYASACFGAVAAKLRDPTICARYNAGLGIDYLWSCYTNYSISTGDVSGCANINALASSNRFTCVFGTAKKYGNATACELILDAGSKNICYQGVTIYPIVPINPAGCQGVTNFVYRDECYKDVAKETNNTTWCNYSSTTDTQMSCQNSVMNWANNSR